MLERVFREPKFRVRCLGGLKLIEAGSGTDMTPASRKTRALIGYLCIVGKPVGRERLASLLWGDRGDEQARASLRQATYELRSMAGGDRLLTGERDTIAVGGEVVTDVSVIMAAAQSGDLQRLSDALSEWNGDFFEDLPPIDPSFDAWLQSERVRIQDTLIEGAAAAVKGAIARGEIHPARKIVNLLHQRDGSNEVVLRLGLQLDHLAGDSAALHRRYERFRNLLKSELNAVPSVETQRLFRELASSAQASAVVSASDAGGADNVDRVQPNDSALTNSVQPLVRGTAKSATQTDLSGLPLRIGHRMGLAATVLAVASLCVFAWIVWRPAQKPAPARQFPLLAVLPFENLSADAGSRYFSDGLTEEIVDALLRTTQVRVVSPGSSFRFRNAGAAKAARALAATHVLSGSVERSGDHIHLVAQLRAMRDGSVTWSHDYDRTIEQAPALRRDIAVQIADALDMRLSASSLKEEQINPAAYDHYLKGRDLFLQRDLQEAEPELVLATRLAPDVSKAWSTLAAVRIVRVSQLFSERKQDDEALMERAARAAANRALALDPNNGEALAVLAHLTPATHLKEVDRLFQRALQSEPNNTQLLNWHGAFLWFVGRNHESIDELTRAYDIDRVTPTIAENLAEAYLWAGRYQDAKAIMDLARDSNLQTAFFQLRAQYFLFRRDWQGLANALRVLPEFLSPANAALFALSRDTAAALAKNAGDQSAALRARWQSARSLDPEEAVQFLSALGDTAGALEFVEQSVAAHRQRDRYLIDPGWTALFPANLAALRRDPRVPRLFSKWGLFDYWRSINRWPDFCYEPRLPFDCKIEGERQAVRNGSAAPSRRNALKHAM